MFFEKEHTDQLFMYDSHKMIPVILSCYDYAGPVQTKTKKMQTVFSRSAT
jgi:hypothetical protein